jgi:hypothetical protein
MPRIRLKRFLAKTPKKVRLVVMTDKRIFKRMPEILRRVDEQIEIMRARDNRPPPLDKDETARVEVKIVKKGKVRREAVHELTAGGLCHRPDLFLDGGKNCDACALYPWCLYEKKRLKDKNSQPPDRNAEFFKKQSSEKVYAEVVQPSRPRIRIQKVRIKIRK